MTCFYSLSEENAQLKEENERLREFVEFVASLTVSLPPGVDQEKFSYFLVNVLKADALKALGERD